MTCGHCSRRHSSDTNYPPPTSTISSTSQTADRRPSYSTTSCAFRKPNPPPPPTAPPSTLLSSSLTTTSASTACCLIAKRYLPNLTWRYAKDNCPPQNMPNLPSEAGQPSTHFSMQKPAHLRARNSPSSILLDRASSSTMRN